MTDHPSLADALYRYVTLKDEVLIPPTEVELADAEHEVDEAALRLMKHYLRGVEIFG